MAVAKSYQSLEKIGEPFSAKGRLYIKVRTRAGSEKTVRWYTDKEYYNLYGEQSPESNAKSATPLKLVLGFKEGYITIIKGDTYSCKDWLSEHGARYTRYWGWYFISDNPIPAELPFGLEPICLPWSKVSTDDNTLIPEDQIKTYVETLLYEPSTSEYFGEIGERYQFTLTVKKVIPINSAYGMSNIHTMEDTDGNTFVWATSAKSLTPGVTYTMTGKVKEHKIYQNSKQTWLTRCLSISPVKS